jgi:hypothetical protein
MSALPPVLISEAQLNKRVALTALVALGIFVFLCFHFAVDWYWCLPGVIFLLLLAGCVGKQVRIDQVARVVGECQRLLGRWVLSTHLYPFSDFDAIVYERREEAGDTGGRLISVGLQHRSGRRLWVRTFPANNSSRGAEEFAWQLSCDTGIEIRE